MIRFASEKALHLAVSFCKDFGVTGHVKKVGDAQPDSGL